KPAPAQLGEHGDDACTVGRHLTDEEDVHVRGLRWGPLDREQEALDPCSEPDPGRRWTTDLLDQPVVATAAADRVLRPDRLVLELESRTRVVVEPANERRHELVAHAVGVEEGAHRGEVLAAR